MKRARSLLEVAIEREDWEAAALCLLLGVTRAARKLPPEAIEEMIVFLADEAERAHEGPAREHP